MSSSISGTTSPLALSGLTGFDTSSVVSQLVQIESIPMQNLQSQENSIKNVQGLWNQYNSLLTAFKSASDALGDYKLYSGTKATTSNANELTVSSDATAGPGTYNITVLQMAQAQVVQSTQQASNFALSGLPTTGGSFTLNNVQVNVTNGMTLQQIASQINQTIGVGVSASVVNNQMFLVNSQTGATGLTGISDPNSVLNSLGITNTSGQLQSSAIKSQGQDAYVNVFGQTVNQSSNTFANVINGVTFTINNISNSPATPYSSSNPPSTPPTGGDNLTINVASDTSALTTALNNYVTAYNNINSFVKTNTAVNKSDSTKSGALLGNTSLMDYQRMLINTITNPVSLTSNPTSKYNALSAFGITYQTDGTLQIDTTAETNAIQGGHLSDLESLFRQPSTGLVGQMDALMNTLQNKANGFVTTIISGYTTEINSLDSQISNWQKRIQSYQKSLTQQFTQMQLTMQKLQSQGTSMMNMMSGLSTSSSTTG